MLDLEPCSLSGDNVEMLSGASVEQLRWSDASPSRTILAEAEPFHRLGLPQTAYAPADATELGIELDARPTYDEVMAVRAERMATVRGIVDGLIGLDLGRPVTQLRALPLRASRFALRDLAVLESR